MCKVGDIIVINEFKNENDKVISKHSFVVISDEENYISGLKYDFVVNMLCSFHNKKHRNKKIKFKENLEIKETSICGKNINNKTGYIKVDQLYYFDKNLITYKVIACMDNGLLEELIILIIKLNKEGLLKNILTNLKTHL